MIPHKKLFCCILTCCFTVALVLYRCSISPVAGGTGVGNPSGNTIVSIVADTGFVSGEVREEVAFQEDKTLPIMDEDSLVLLVSSVYIVVQKIYFVLDKDQDGDALVSDYQDKLYYEDDSIILEGPFVFDALSGTTSFSFDSLHLPEAKYKGIKLHIANNDSTLMEGYAILLGGTFEYKDIDRNFSIKLTHDITPHYNYKGPAVQISEGDSIQFLVVMNADHWLDYMDIKTDYLDDGSISLDPNTGDLIIDSSTDTNPYKDFKKAVRLNIIKSGVLIISPLK